MDDFRGRERRALLLFRRLPARCLLAALRRVRWRLPGARNAARRTLSKCHIALLSERRAGGCREPFDARDAASQLPSLQRLFGGAGWLCITSLWHQAMHPSRNAAASQKSTCNSCVMLAERSERRLRTGPWALILINVPHFLFFSFLTFAGQYTFTTMGDVSFGCSIFSHRRYFRRSRRKQIEKLEIEN